MSKNCGEKNKASCKRWRESLKKDESQIQKYNLKNVERMRKVRHTWKAVCEGNEKLMEEKRKYNRIRQRERRRKLLMEHEIKNTPYKCRQTLMKAVKKVEKAMPKGMHQRLKVLDVLVKQSKQFKEKETVNNSRISLSESLINAIKDFYQNDNVSVQSSGKKDTVIIEGKLVAKRFMLMTVSEAYELFKKENPSETIGKSTFFKIRPRHVQLVSKMPHNMCVCVYHANFGFLLESCTKSIPSFPTDFEKFLKAVCCDIHNEYCMTNTCKKCITDLQDQFVPVAYLANMDDEVNWQQWLKINNQIALSDTTSTLSELIMLMETKLASFKRHFFVKRAQHMYFQETRINLKPSELVIQVDFAENYRLIHQNEIQSAHFCYRQVTIFTCVAWLAGASKSFAVISDKLTHNKHDVFIFVLNLLNRIKEQYGHFSKISIFSDGSCAQFKNKYILTTLNDIMKQIGCINMEWNFFATSHGKGAVDGVGAIIKRKVWQITKAKNIVLPDALSFYQCAEKHITGIEMYFMPSAEIDNLSLQYKLDEKWKEVKGIPGISQLHSFCCDGKQVQAGSTAYANKKFFF